jgi:hypothetical protein
MNESAPPVSSSARPHRGVLILVLGILSLVTSCFPLGIASWVMGSGDLAAMDRGEIDPSGRSMTQAGRVCGIISVVLAALGLLFFVGIMVVAAIGAGAAGAAGN